MEIAQQKATIERLQAARHDAVALQTEEGETSGSDRDRLVQELQQSQAEVQMMLKLLDYWGVVIFFYLCVMWIRLTP